MKLCNIKIKNSVHLAVIQGSDVLDLTAAGCPWAMEPFIRGGKPISALDEYIAVAEKAEGFVFADIENEPGKLICVGLNYRSHSDKVDLKRADCPILFSKFANALAPSGAPVELPPWEFSYDYEAELVIVIGKTAWNVSEEDALGCVFGYTAGDDFSCRDPQLRTSQWLIGKTMPGFGPCGPCITTADEFDVKKGKRIRSFVNGELRQDGNTEDMIFTCAEIISYASKYIKLEPGDLIFTGTPGGVILEKEEKNYLKPGDLVEVEIEGIGTLVNKMI